MADRRGPGVGEGGGLEAAVGILVQAMSWLVCPDCGGRLRCPGCQGSGQVVRTNRRSGWVGTCPSCNGSGLCRACVLGF